MESKKIKELLAEMTEEMRERAKSALKELNLLKNDTTLENKKYGLLSYDINSIVYLFSNEGKWCFLSDVKIKYLEKALSYYFKLPVFFNKEAMAFVLDLEKDENVKLKNILIRILGVNEENKDELYSTNKIVAELHYIDEKEDFMVEFLGLDSNRISESFFEKISECVYNLNRKGKMDIKKKDLYSLSIGDKFNFFSSGDVYQKVSVGDISVAIINVRTGEIASMPAGTYINEIIFSF